MAEFPHAKPNVRNIVVVTGPTASGKTEVALNLARQLPVDLISMDSAMVYRGMDIGTAKPDRALLREFPHALVDICDPADAYSVAQFVADADAAVRRAFERGRLPVLVGGTMLYLRAFREGLADLPPADPAVRESVRQAARARGWDALHQELQQVDPEAARGIHPNNPQRLGRALEVYRQTGRPISRWWREQQDVSVGRRLGARLLEFAIVPAQRPMLHERIAERFDGMLARGFIAEVDALRRRGDLSPELPSMRSVGYRQAWQHLEGHFDRAELRQRALAATRQLAKRQLTWLRAWPGIRRFEPGDPALLAARIRELGRLEIC
ncbi:MAG: tRNA (adenosine(37)-N6)-dimethylallyltransferase MiaA [Pseudomonadales bacterium]